MNKQIFVKAEDLTCYFLHAQHTNRIQKFWKEILHSMPEIVRLEAQKKFTRLIQQENSEFDISGAIAYQFEIEHASPTLSYYLNRFVVFVEHDTQEISNWKKKIGNSAHSFS